MAGALTVRDTPAVETGEPLRDAELRQRQIRANIQKVTVEIDALIADFERNGLGAAQDVRILQGIRNALTTLTDKEMEEVIALLQTARAAADPATTQKTTLKAFNSQKQILLRLHQLILEHQRRETLHELGRLLRDLAARQELNLRETIALSELTGGKSLSSFDDSQRSALDLQSAEQKAIHHETVQLLAALETLAAAPASDQRPKLALQHAKTAGLETILEAAVNDLAEARLLSAAGNEKTARDHLRTVARLLSAPQDDVSRLRQAIRDLDTVIHHQRELIAQTQTRPDNTLAARQAENIDRADQLRQDTQNLAPIASTQIQDAIYEMQKARAELGGTEPSRALPSQQTALQHLQNARQSLEQQFAKTQPDSTKPTDPRAALTDAQKKLATLRQQQDELKKDSATKPDKQQADKQLALQQQTQNLQQQTAPHSPQAAAALGEAARQMQKAANALQSQQPATDAQQAAQAALQQAAEAMRNDAARLDQAADELKSVEAVLATLAQLIQRQQKLEFATAKLLANTASKPTATELAPNQQQLTADTESLRTHLPPNARAADRPLAAARQNMTAASGWLQSARADAAHPPQQQALANLYAAKNALEQQRDDLAAQLGQLPDNHPELTRAMQDLAKAQQDTADAQQLLDQVGGAQMQQLQQRQQELAQNLRQSPAAQDPLAPASVAQRSAQQAANQLAQGNLNAAMQSMQQALAALRPPEPQPAQTAAEPTPPQQPAQPGQPSQPTQNNPPSQNNPPTPPAQSSQPGQAAPTSQPTPSLQPFAQQQQRLLEAAQQLAGTRQDPNGQATMQEAAQALQDAANIIGAMASNPGNLPGTIAQPIQNAQMALANAAAQASGATPAQAGAAAAHAAAAQNAMAQAQAALSAALAAESGQQSQGQGQAQGQGQGQGQSQAQAQGQAQGGTPSGTSSGEGNWNGATAGGGLAAIKAAGGQFIGLPPRDRAAIRQSQSEKYPQEFGPLIEQYMKNLADQTSDGK